MGKAGKQKRELTKEEKSAKAKKRLENYNPIMAARNALRREFSRSPVVIALMQDPATSRLVPKYKKDGSRAKKDAREHLCTECKKWSRSSKGKKVTIDHIDPVVCPKAGYIDLNTYYSRMWVPKDRLQKLCGDCHQFKTNIEWKERRLKDDLLLVEIAAKAPREEAKRLLRRFTNKRLTTSGYPKEFINKVESLKSSLKGAA